MGRNDKDQIAKFIGIAVGCVIAFYVLMSLLPYIELFLALCGAWYLYQEYERNNRRNRH
jgi:uncharacterized BrkB/YihY/UPF0761 family membrane protein